MNSSISLLVYLIGLSLTILFLAAIEVPHNLDMFEKPICIEGKIFYIRKSFVFAIMAFIPMWYLMAFRGITVGTDTIGTYYRYYKYSLQGYPISAFGSEFAYYAINRITMLFASSYHAVIIVVSSISWILFYSYICKNSASPSFSILVFFLTFFYFRQYNGVRQMLAEAIILHGFRYIYERKFLKYCGVIAIAFCFHNTAIVLLPIYFLYRIKLTPRMTGRIIVITKAITSLMVKYILPRMLVGTKYYRMIYDQRAYIGGYWISDIFVSGTILLFCIYIIGVNNDDKINFNTWLILISFALSINSNVLPAVGRILWYSNINIMICIPLLINKFDRKLDKAVAFGSIMLVLIMYFYQQWSLGIEKVQHYIKWST